VGLESREELRAVYPEWVEDRLREWGLERVGFWTESLAVGSKEFVDATLKALWPRARGKKIEEPCVSGEPREFVLRESITAYGDIFRSKKHAVGRKGDGQEGLDH
jgi:hypothetical protein